MWQNPKQCCTHFCLRQWTSAALSDDAIGPYTLSKDVLIMVKAKWWWRLKGTLPIFQSITHMFSLCLMVMLTLVLWWWLYWWNKYIAIMMRIKKKCWWWWCLWCKRHFRRMTNTVRTLWSTCDYRRLDWTLERNLWFFKIYLATLKRWGKPKNWKTKNGL